MNADEKMALDWIRSADGHRWAKIVREKDPLLFFRIQQVNRANGLFNEKLRSDLIEALQKYG